MGQSAPRNHADNYWRDRSRRLDGRGSIGSRRRRGYAHPRRRGGGPMNPDSRLQFDFGAWRRHLAFTPAQVRERVGWTIAGPEELVAVETVRSKALRFGDLGPSVPCDIHIFVHGEAPRRDATVIGGVPYRPRTMPWPTRRDGTPMVFVCQFAFHQSQDIFGARTLPGDLLLVFA